MKKNRWRKSKGSKKWVAEKLRRKVLIVIRYFLSEGDKTILRVKNKFI